MNLIVYIILVACVVIAAQYYLSSRRLMILGGILPVLFIGFTVWVKISLSPNANLTGFILMFVVLVGEWADGRITYKKKNGEKNK